MFRIDSPDRLTAAPRRRSRGALTLALTLGLSTIAAVAAPTVANAQTAPRDAAVIEAEFIAGVNALRANNGLPAFIVDTEIRAVAMAWTVNMADAGGISHNPNLAKEITASWRKLGENVGTGGDAATVEVAFENSPGHRRNLLDPEFTHMALTVVVRGDWIYVTQQFRTPGQSVAPAAVKAPSALALVAPPKAAVKGITVKSGKTRRSVRTTTRA